jgi:hypothetical protein
VEIQGDEAAIVDAYTQAEQLRLRRILDEVGHTAKMGTEDFGRSRISLGPGIYRAQVTSAIGPASLPTIGTGTVLLCILIGTTVYRVYPHVSVNVVNDVGDTIAVNRLVWITQVDGRWSVLLEDCATTTPTAFSDQPH